MEDKTLLSMASSATQFVSDDEDHFATPFVPVPSGGSEFGLAERGGGGVGRGGQKNDVDPNKGRHGRTGIQGMTTSKPSAHVQDEIMQSGGAWAKHEKQKQAMRKVLIAYDTRAQTRARTHTHTHTHSHTFIQLTPPNCLDRSSKRRGTQRSRPHRNISRTDGTQDCPSTLKQMQAMAGNGRTRKMWASSRWRSFLLRICSGRGRI